MDRITKRTRTIECLKARNIEGCEPADAIDSILRILESYPDYLSDERETILFTLADEWIKENLLFAFEEGDLDSMNYLAGNMSKLREKWKKEDEENNGS